jgi:cytochrome oxidase Cu insertion factor (SCO1/SenC/PrrC family)
MPGSNSSLPGSPAVTEAVSFTVHSMPSPALADDERRTRAGRLKMLLVLAACAAPVIASYFTYFVLRPQARTNYSELVLPPRPLPDLPLVDLSGRAIEPASLKGQWLLVVVSGGDCDATCEEGLLLQRQLRETLGRERGRLDKLWLVVDDARIRPEVLEAVVGKGSPEPATILRVPREALARWLEPAAGQALEAHLYVVDPMGAWMMRSPPRPEPARLKRDIDKLLRASASWDREGR